MGFMRVHFTSWLRNKGDCLVMIKDNSLLEAFEREEIAAEKLSHAEALRLFEAMWRQGMALGVLPLQDPLEGIEVDIEIARILNHVPRAAR
jgi:hypothetical protein